VTAGHAGTAPLGSAGPPRRADRRRFGAFDAGTPAAVLARVGLTGAELCWLLLALFLGVDVPGRTPTTGLDPGWILGLNLSRPRGLHFGTDLVFTYGPWGFLDVADATNRLQIVLGTIFVLAAMIGYWYALRRALRPLGSGWWMAPIVTGLAVISATLVTSSTLILATAAYVSTVYLVDSPSGRWWRFTPVFLAAVGGLLIQVKFSDGAFTLALAPLVAVFGPAPVRNLVRAAITALVVFLVGWLVLEHSFGGIVSWAIGSLHESSGYVDAMGTEPPDAAWGYVLGLILTVLLLGATIRHEWPQPLPRRIGAVLVAALVLYFGWKEGYIRDGLGHRQTLFIGVFLLLVRFVRPRHYRLGAMIVVIGSLIFCQANPEVFWPRNAAVAWGHAARLVGQPGYQGRILSQAKSDARDEYQIPPSMLAAVGTDPVSIDPISITAAWAYDLNWAPVPIFQNYSAYEPYLDKRNAQALADAPANQVVLRQPRGAIDGRNRDWDPPLYQRELACGYDVVSHDDNWLMFRKATTNRCGAVSPVSTVPAERGQTITVPTVEPNQMLTMSITLDSPNPFVRLGQLIFKDFRHFQIVCNTHTYRVPKAFADGPLMLTVPSATGWPRTFGGGSVCKTITLNMPGTVRFSETAVS
jgi:hypothetical protein